MQSLQDPRRRVRATIPATGIEEPTIVEVNEQALYLALAIGAGTSARDIADVDAVFGRVLLDVFVQFVMRHCGLQGP